MASALRWREHQAPAAPRTAVPVSDVVMRDLASGLVLHTSAEGSPMYNEELVRAVIADRVREREMALRLNFLFGSERRGAARRRSLRSLVRVPTFMRDGRADGV